MEVLPILMENRRIFGLQFLSHQVDFFLIGWNLPHLILFSEIISQKIEKNVKKIGVF